jgi:hypothetical protein
LYRRLAAQVSQLSNAGSIPRDSGGHFFNFPEFVGNVTAITISNAYYPAADRDVSAGLTN